MGYFAVNIRNIRRARAGKCDEGNLADSGYSDGVYIGPGGGGYGVLGK